MGVELARAYVTVTADTRQMVFHFRKAQDQMGGGLKKLGDLAEFYLITRVADAFRRLAKHVLDVISEFEQMHKRLEILIGDSEKAKKLQDYLTKFAQVAPFGFMEVQSAAASLLNVQVELDAIPPLLRIIGDAASMAKLNMEDLALVFAKVYQLRTLQAREFNQLIRQQVPGLSKALEKLSGTSIEEFRKKMKQGVGPSIGLFVRVLEEMGKKGGPAFDAMRKFAGTLAGETEKLKDQVVLLAVAIGYDLLPGIKFIIRKLKDLVQIVRNAWNAIGSLGQTVVIFGTALATTAISFAVFARAAIMAKNAIQALMIVLTAGGGLKAFLQIAAVLIVAAGLTYILSGAVGELSDEYAQLLNDTKENVDALNRLKAMTGGGAEGGGAGATGAGRFGISAFGSYLQDMLLRGPDKQGQMVTLLEEGNRKQDELISEVRRGNRQPNVGVLAK